MSVSVMSVVGREMLLFKSEGTMRAGRVVVVVDNSTTGPGVTLVPSLMSKRFMWVVISEVSGPRFTRLSIGPESASMMSGVRE